MFELRSEICCASTSLPCTSFELCSGRIFSIARADWGLESCLLYGITFGCSWRWSLMEVPLRLAGNALPSSLYNSESKVSMGF